MQRDRQAELLRPPGQRLHAGQDADGGDGDVPGADAEPLGWLRMLRAVSTAGQLSSGSPMPMKTMLVGRSSGVASTISRTCPAISNGVRLRRKPMRPVAQKAQRRAHPACDEMQSVRREPLGMSTDSIASPSARRQRYFRVPSADCWTTSALQPGQGKAPLQLGAERGGQLGGVFPAPDRRGPEPPQHLVRPVARQSPLRRPGLQGGAGAVGAQVEQRFRGGAVDHVACRWVRERPPKRFRPAKIAPNPRSGKAAADG